MPVQPPPNYTFEPPPAEAMSPVVTKDFENFGRQSAEDLGRGVQAIGAHNGWDTTYTLFALPGGREQAGEFQAHFGCHLPKKHKITFSEYLDQRFELSDPDRVILKTAIEAKDHRTGATYHYLWAHETRPDRHFRPTLHTQTVVRNEKGKVISYLDEYRVEIRNR